MFIIFTIILVFLYGIERNIPTLEGDSAGKERQFDSNMTVSH